MSEVEKENTTHSGVDDVLPDWAREQLTKANAEAAKYRTQKNEAVQAARAEVEAEFSKRVEKLEADLEAERVGSSSSRNEVERLKVALEAGISSDKVVSFAGLLKGDTEEKLRSHAEELKKLFGTGKEPESKQRASDRSQGRSSERALNDDKLLTDILRIVNK